MQTIQVNQGDTSSLRTSHGGETKLVSLRGDRADNHVDLRFRLIFGIGHVNPGLRENPTDVARRVNDSDEDHSIFPNDAIDHMVSHQDKSQSRSDVVAGFPN